MMNAKNKFWPICFCFLLLSTLSCAAQIVINEFSSKNETGITDQDGDFSDWIELHNGGTTTVYLQDFGLSDNEEDPYKWTFPTVLLAPGETFLVFASGKDTITNEIHTNFSIKAGGEPLALSDNWGNLLDLVSPQSLTVDQTYGRSTDGSPDWSFYLNGGTPGYSNNALEPQQNLGFSHESGYFSNAFDLALFSSGGGTIHYTLDCSLPTSSSPVYQNPLTIASRAGDPNILSNIICTEPEDFVAPTEEIFKINIIRAGIFQDGELVSEIYTKSFLIDSDPNRYTIPMVSLVTDADNFFDDEVGIYVPGSNFDGTTEGSMNIFQTGSDWERPVHFEFIDTSGNSLLSQDAGVRIHGGGSRRRMQKSLRLYARNDYGKSHFNYPFFTDRNTERYKRLVLRAQQSSNFSFMSDEVGSNIARELGVERMATRPVVVFLNGEFWGVYHIRERIDEHFFSEHYNVAEENLTMMENDANVGLPEFGTDAAYLQFLEDLANMDMTQAAAYDYVEQTMDVDEYLNYLILNLFIANYDWPGNNVKYWKSPDFDDKWRWVFFDADFAFRLEDRPSIPNFMNNLESNTTEWGTHLAQTLLENPAIENRFIELFEYHLNNSFSPENLACHFRQYADLLDAQMDENIDRFYAPFDYDYWVSRLEDVFEEFLSLRTCYIQEQILEQFGIVVDVPDDTCPLLAEDYSDCPNENLAFPHLFEVDLKVFLEGPYNPILGEMEPLLLEQGLLPTEQPYNVYPWNYNGEESIGHLNSLPNEAIDWVLVEVRTGSPSLVEINTEVVETQAGILLANGNIVNPNTGQDLMFRELTPNNYYYFVVRHRNHLDVISAGPVQAVGEMEYDFRLGQTMAFGIEQLKLLENGTVAMHTGDYNGDGLIQTTDYDLWFLNSAVLSTYQSPDANLDGLIQTTDFDAWFLNKSKLGVPGVQF